MPVYSHRLPLSLPGLFDAFWQVRDPFRRYFVFHFTGNVVHFLIDLRCSAWLSGSHAKKRWLLVRLIANILFPRCTAYAPSHFAITSITCSPPQPQSLQLPTTTAQNLRGNGMWTTSLNKHSNSTQHPLIPTESRVRRVQLWFLTDCIGRFKLFSNFPQFVYDMPQGLAIKPKPQDSSREGKHAFDLFINIHKTTMKDNECISSFMW